MNDAFVRAFVPGRSPLGETLQHPRPRKGEVRTIVGIVHDAVFDSQREGIQPIVYLPVAQSAGIGPSGLTAISLGVRPTVRAPVQLAPGVGAAPRGIDPEVSFSFGATLREGLGATRARNLGEVAHAPAQSATRSKRVRCAAQSAALVVGALSLQVVGVERLAREALADTGSSIIGFD